MRLVVHQQNRCVCEGLYEQPIRWNTTGREMHGHWYLRKSWERATGMFAAAANLVVRREARAPRRLRKRGNAAKSPPVFCLQNLDRPLPGRGASKAMSRSRLPPHYKASPAYSWLLCFAPCAGLCGLARVPSRQSCKSCESRPKGETGFPACRRRRREVEGGFPASDFGFPASRRRPSLKRGALLC